METEKMNYYVFAGIPIDTKTIPHRKFTIPIPWNPKCGKKVTYYIAQIPCEGFRTSNNFQIHEKVDGCDLGYGGSELEFLMVDGTTEKVKGPFFQYQEQHARILFDILTCEPWKPITQ